MTQILEYKPGVSLSYAEFGNKNGYPILIQHGLIASIRDFHLFDRLLQIGTHLVCIARPGYGESSPYLMNNLAEWGEIVAALVEELRLSSFDVLGLSSGAPYSYAICRKFSERVRNLFIFSGIPALYDETILSFWPYPVNKNASIPELEDLAHELFFSGLSPADLSRNYLKDSMSNHCFGLAQDFKLRCVDWGFNLSEVKNTVFMQHSKTDSDVPFITAQMTSKLLPDCKFETRESGAHFSNEILDQFIQTTMYPFY